MSAKSRKRLVHITLDEKLLGDANKLKGIVHRIELATGEKSDASPRLQKYGILSTLADNKSKKAVSDLTGVVAVEEDEIRSISD